MKNTLFRSASLILCLAAWMACAFAQTPHTHQHSFADAEKWRAVFDDPARDAWQKPHQVLVALALEADATVADLGAGTGYFAMRLAHFVPKGRVYAVDTEPGMVKHLAARAQESALVNVTAIQGVADDPRLPEKVDLVLLVDVYHHLDAREKYFAMLRASLKPGGRVAVIDFKLASPVGPPRSARLSADSVRDEMRTAGYALVQEHGFLPNQYFLVFAPLAR
ncbi:MAG: methyltransferase domain-containing protein [Betaproteobacteria bacterium]|nr:methyltransferase domain-containing protein [Betaproteobacteria bacterium]